MSNVKIPNRLNTNSTIGLIAPSDGANLRYLDKAIENLKKLGFKVVEKNVRNSDKFVSGSSKQRVDDFLRLYFDDSIDYLIGVRGGEFLSDILPLLDEKKEYIKNSLKTHKLKFMQGYSDISLLNLYLTTTFNIATVNSGIVTDFAMREFDKSVLKNIEFMLEGDDIFIQEKYDKFQITRYEDRTKGLNLTEDVKYHLIESENMNSNNNNDNSSNKTNNKIQREGILIGGCMEAITQILGTKFDNVHNFCKQQSQGVIWYLDIFDSDVIKICTTLNQMKNVGWFENISMLLIGRTFNNDSIEDFTYEDAIKKAISNLNIPVIYDVDIGHMPPQFVLVNGAKTKVEYDISNDKFKIYQSLKNN